MFSKCPISFKLNPFFPTLLKLHGEEKKTLPQKSDGGPTDNFCGFCVSVKKLRQLECQIKVDILILVTFWCNIDALL